MKKILLGAGIAGLVSASALGWYFFVKIPDDIRQHIKSELGKLEAEFVVSHGSIDVDVLAQEARLNDLQLISHDEILTIHVASISGAGGTGESTLPVLTAHNVNMAAKNAENAKNNTELSVDRISLSGLAPQTLSVMQGPFDPAKFKNIKFDQLALTNASLKTTFGEVAVNHFALDSFDGFSFADLQLSDLQIENPLGKGKVDIVRVGGQEVDWSLAEIDPKNGKQRFFAPMKWLGPTLIAGFEANTVKGFWGIKRFETEEMLFDTKTTGKPIWTQSRLKMDDLQFSSLLLPFPTGLLPFAKDLNELVTVDFDLAAEQNPKTETLSVSNFEIQAEKLAHFQMKAELIDVPASWMEKMSKGSQNFQLNADDPELHDAKLAGFEASILDFGLIEVWLNTAKTDEGMPIKAIANMFLGSAYQNLDPDRDPITRSALEKVGQFLAGSAMKELKLSISPAIPVPFGSQFKDQLPDEIAKIFGASITLSEK